MDSPKKKAKEIYFSMLNAGKGMVSDYLAKQCALIAIDLQIEAHSGPRHHIKIYYWHKVKDALKKL